MTRREARVKATGMIAAFVFVTMSAWISSFAADPRAADAAMEHSKHATATQAHAPAANQPIHPPFAIRWPVIIMIVVLGMFVSAMVIGPIARMTMPEEPLAEAAHKPAHDDHAGPVDHGHGHDGHH